jgi:uncharacterized protein (TIGR02246 family)
MKRIVLIAAGAAALLVAGCGEAKKAKIHAALPAHTTMMPTRADIEGLFDLWNETLQTGSPHDMAMLYAEDGVLLPTVSNQARNNRPEIADYFEHFLKLSPRGAINEQYVDVLDADTAVNSGIYTFDVVKDGQPTFVVARYSFIYEKVDGKWLIKSHHSSAMPEAVHARPQTLAARRGGAKVIKASASEAHAENHGEKHAEAGHGEKAHH